MKRQSSGEWRVFAKLIRDTKPSKIRLFAALVMSIITTIGSLIIPMFTKNMVNGFSLTSIGATGITVLVIAFLSQAITSGFSIYLLNYVGHKVVASLREGLWKKLLVLPLAYYDKHRTGETISRVTNDTGVVKALITEHLPQFCTGTISIIGSISVLFYLDWKMTLVMLISVPLAVGILVPLGKSMYKISKGLQDETASFTAILTQVLSEVRLVKASNAEEVEYARANEKIETLFRFGLREAKVQAVVMPAMFLIIMVLLVVIIGYGGMSVSSGAVSAGDLVAFILYLFQIVIPLTSFTNFFTQLKKATGATERIVDTLSEGEEDFASGTPLQDTSDSIVMENVSFSYHTGEPVIRDLNATFAAGKVTAIVGPSGGGKTTLFGLLERFYIPQEGNIRIGSRTIFNTTLQSWRSQIGYVSQESPVIAGTIRENLCYGTNREVSERELADVIEMAYASEFIQGLPDGMDTEVGERGVKLSGGQRQRIAIARALLRDPKILMLDEATSSLDSRSEHSVQKALKNLMQGRTTLIIAHRLSTVIDANCILFIEKGSVTGRGTHAELLQTHPMYREFAEQQLKLKEASA